MSENSMRLMVSLPRGEDMEFLVKFHPRSIMRVNVDFPAALGPTIAVTPSGTIARPGLESVTPIYCRCGLLRYISGFMQQSYSFLLQLHCLFML